MLTEKDSRCYVCGPENPLGLQVAFTRDGSQGSRAHYVARAEHGGWKGILHGGVTFALMDEALGWALYFQELPAVTARVETRFHKPIAVGTAVVVKGWIVKQKGRLYEGHAEVREQSNVRTLLAECDAVMYRTGHIHAHTSTERSEEKMPNANKIAYKVTIRSFQPGDEGQFRQLNEQWIKSLFHMEAKDESAFGDPQHDILSPGGRILMACVQDQVIGCGALLRMSADEYEVAKMAVAPEHRQKGVGRLLLQALLDEARHLRARRLYLETNHRLKNAIRLYQTLGFRPLNPDKITPSPYERADVYMELLLD